MTEDRGAQASMAPPSACASGLVAATSSNLASAHKRPLGAPACTTCQARRTERKDAVFDHLSLGVKDLARATAFYDVALSPLGHIRLFESPRAVCYGPRDFTGAEPPFAILPIADTAPTPRFHLAFSAGSRDAVDRFHAAAVTAGGTDDGPPGIRMSYNPGYYAAFVIDPDGHRIEAVCHEPVSTAEVP